MNTKEKIALKISEEFGVSKIKAKEVTEIVFAEIFDELKNNEQIILGDTGKLVIVDKPSRMVRNPLTGETVMSKPYKKIKFRPSKKLKETIGAK